MVKDKESLGFVFDLDGTLINSTDVGSKVEEKIYQEFDIRIDDQKEKEIEKLTYEILHGENRKNLGRKLMWEIFKVLGLSFFQRIRALFMANKIFKEEIKKVSLYEGVREFFNYLDEENHKYVIATTSSRKEVDDRLRKFPQFYQKLEGKIITRDDVENMKPAPDQINKAFKIMDVSPDRCIMIGDMHSDILMGKKVGAITVGVLTGVFDKEQFNEVQPDFIIESVADLSSIVDDIKARVKN
ncbi:MAG: putative Pyrophosphatase PpaX [Promethearchaeota archaeon]|nr:MAG: putative Pyrophosphatase PpaX [Candidatus Lokiarchaeota archaeon]